MNKINEMPNYLTISIPSIKDSCKISNINKKLNSQIIPNDLNNMMASSIIKKGRKIHLF